MSLSSASTITKIVVMGMIGVGVLALTLMDVRGVMHGGPGVQDAATVNGERITTRDVAMGAERLANQMNVPRDKINSVGLKQYVLQQIVIEKLTEEAMRDLGLRFSDKAVAAELRTMLSDPKNPNGDIAQRYEMFLRQSGQNRKEVENNVRTQIARRVVTEGLSAALLPDPLLDNAKKAFAQERRDIAIITFTPDPSAVKTAPSDEMLESLYEARKAEYTVPEKRSGRVFAISSDELKKMAGKDGDVQAALTEIEDAFFGGDTPEAVAKQYGLSVDKTIKDMEKPEGFFGTQLFQLESGEVSNALPLENKKGYGFVALDTITPAKAKPLSEVRDVIVQAWKKDEARAHADARAATVKAADDPIATARKEGAQVEMKSAVAPSDELAPLFELTETNRAVEIPTKDKDVVKLGVVSKIAHGDSAWTPSESTVKDFQAAQAQPVDELFMQMMAPTAAKAKITVNEKAFAPAPAPQE